MIEKLFIRNWSLKYVLPIYWKTRKIDNSICIHEYIEYILRWKIDVSKCFVYNTEILSRAESKVDNWEKELYFWMGGQGCWWPILLPSHSDS